MTHVVCPTTRGIPFRRTLLTLLLLLAPLAARADSRGDAKRHYRTGMSLIAAGKLERGIAELKQAYAIKPHPDVLYNIARAYVDLGEIREALSYFQSYAATDPKDRAQVEAVMARLSAATKIPLPAEADTQPAQPAAPSLDPQKLLADIQEMISRSKAERAAVASPPAPIPEKKAAVPAKASAPPAKAAAPASDDMFEPTPITADTRATAQEIAAALAPRVDENIFEEQGAAPASRPRSEAKTQPVATIMGEDEIRLSGAATIPELLRRIPGIDPADIGAAEIRGLNRRGPAKVLVLVDGRSAVQELLGGTTWPLFDLALSQVARIEIVRGPAPSVLGTISIATVVNVVTKAGEDAAGARRAEEATAQGGVAAGGKIPK